MIGPIAQKKGDTLEDAGVHVGILDAVNFKKSKALAATQAKLVAMGLDTSAVKAAMGLPTGKSYGGVLKGKARDAE